jgi:hypothetical protein
VLAISALMIAATAAYADTVTNDIVASVNDTMTSGGSLTAQYKINATGGDSQTGCNASDGSNATVNIVAPAGVTATPNSLVFNYCGMPTKGVNFTSTTPGDYSITVNVSDSGAGTYNTTPATFTLHVLASADAADPTVDCAVPDQTVWYGANVAVPCTASDSDSPPAIPASFSLSTSVASDIETASASTGTQVVCDSAATPNCVTVGPYTFKVDLKAPVVSCGSADSSWHATNQSVSCTATDGGSGLADGGDSSFEISTSVPDGVADASAFTDSRVVDDNVGNASTAGPVGPFKIDREDPTITIASPPDGATYVLGDSIEAVFDCDDGSGSGISTCVGDVADGSDIDTSSVGGHTFTVDAEDNVENKNTLTHDYSVIYDWSGFFAPVDNQPTFNVVKAGQSIPMKFSLNGDHGMGIIEAGYPTSKSITCDTDADWDSLELVATAGASGLNYDATADQYNFIWKTDKAWANACRQFVLKLEDGTYHRANFKFTR